jgi:hypothetical protein
VLKTAASLSARERAQLAAFLGEPDPEARTRLADSLSLMLENPIPRDWLAREAPHLVGRDIMLVTPEGLFNAAGGLGRVTQYHSSAMVKLAGEQARVWVFEAMYSFRPAPGPTTELVFGTPSLRRPAAGHGKWQIPWRCVRPCRNFLTRSWRPTPTACR